MKRTSIYLKVAIVVIALVTMSMAAQGQQASGVKTIPIKIKYMENGNIIPNSAVYFLYQDLEKREMAEKTVNTGNGNVVTFNVPLDKDGASYPFIYVFTKDEADKLKELAKKSAIRAYRTPSGGKCEFLELSVTKGGGTQTGGCAIQMWSIDLTKK